MVRLVEDILNFSRLELDKTRIEFSDVDLNSVVEQAVTAQQARAKAANLPLIFESDATLPPVLGEPSQLGQMVRILLDNALNYTSDGAVRVVTSLKKEPRLACLQVIDTGTGVHPEDLPHIFERFYRGRGVGSSNIPGTGLGLSLAQEIANLHGGRIEVESQVGTGSTFTVFFPLEDGVK
jgi:signal transduction histidine kinase